ncbi:CMGC/CDK protein kinase [Plasmodium vinckei petteri]|uniref:non-specific serine/threonine protein kinase n=1 Tax=Plasmodium vinckei petteri TaxID=138298 RepID=W7AKF4_PLAVN|nr:CMGC/CDK protein kinase [Plasmodium vinckei petteri]CAD2106182.1 cdc2-related protein kinase 4, putative [Plasmodium vinckei petteri]
MDRILSKLVKNNELNIDKSLESENHDLGNINETMNGKKKLSVNSETNGENVVKRTSLRKVKNENDNLETSYLINTRSKENNKKNMSCKGIDKGKKNSYVRKSLPIKSTNSNATENEENYVANDKNNNSKGLKYTILNYFRGNSNNNNSNINNNCEQDEQNDRDNDNNTRIDNEIRNIRSSSEQQSQHDIEMINGKDAQKNQRRNTFDYELNQNSYLQMKNNIENNLMNYKKCKLDNLNIESYNIDSCKSNNMQNDEQNVGMANSSLYGNKEYTNDDEMSQIKETNILNNCNEMHPSIKNSIASIMDVNNSSNTHLSKNGLKLSDLHTSKNCDASLLKSKNSIYKYKMADSDNKESVNNSMIRGIYQGIVENQRFNNGDENNLNVVQFANAGIIRNDRMAMSHLGINSNVEENQLKIYEPNASRYEIVAKGSQNEHLYNYKERNKEYLDLMNVPFNRDNNVNKDLLIRSLPNKNLLNECDEELFSKNILNFENYFSYKLKKNINNNIINNICNMYESGENLDALITNNRRKKNDSYNKNCNEDYGKLKSGTFFNIPNDYFESEKLFKRPKMRSKNMLVDKQNIDNPTNIQPNENNNISTILMNHHDLLINKREKLIINNDVDNKDDEQSSNNDFWLTSRKEFFSKICKNRLELTNEEVEKLKEVVDFRGEDGTYTVSSIFNKYNETIDEEHVLKEYVTDDKLKNFSLNLIDGFLYDKQSLYEREMIENDKIFSRIHYNHKNADIKIDKLLNLFPRDFMKKYKIVKKLGEGVYGKVFKAESLDDSYLNFAVKVLRYFWPNFKYKFGSEEFAINEFNIMRILFHPNVVCLLDSFRVHTYRKNKIKSHRGQKTRCETLSAEYDFSFQRHRRMEKVQYSPSRETVERNNKYRNLVSKSCLTIEELEQNLVLNSVDKETTIQDKGNLYNNHTGKLDEMPTIFTNNNSVKMLNYDEENTNLDNNKNNLMSTKLQRDIKRDRSGDLYQYYPLKKKMKTTNYKNGKRNEAIKVTNRSIDKLKFRKHSKKLKKIENKNDDYIENWDLFLVIEKCDCSLNDILNKAKKKHFSFIQDIKKDTTKCLPTERIDLSYDHLHNYVKYVYLPLKKIENRYFYPDMPSLTEMQTKVIIYQMLQGINHFHKKFIIHRDIKPANTLIKNIQYLSDGLNDSKEWIVKIADFGLGVYDHFLKTETKDCNIITLQYRPPEILCNSTLYNYSVDIWSIGITMCECLLGFVPVTSKFESSVLFKILVFRGIPDQNFDNLLKKELVGELPKFKVDRIKMLEIIFTDIYGRRILNDKGLDLIDQFLSYDYKNRITANEALKHEWFEDVHLYLNEDLLNYYKRNGTYYF